MSTHRASGTRLYNCWKRIRQRCNNKNSPDYKNYGGRGIIVMFTCFEDFRDWALNNGYDEKLTIDRVDNDGPYARDNCRWATWEVQNKNSRHNVMITHPETGETLCAADWSRRIGGNKLLVSFRIRNGYSPVRAITEPVNKQYRRKIK